MKRSEEGAGGVVRDQKIRQKAREQQVQRVRNTPTETKKRRVDMPASPADFFLAEIMCMCSAAASRTDMDIRVSLLWQTLRGA